MHSLDSEIREVVKVKDLNIELMEHLTFTADWLLRYCERNNVWPPNTDRLLELMHRAKGLIQKICQPYIPTESQQRFKTPDDSTEPKIVIKLISYKYLKVASQLIEFEIR
jgi:hypothetical protein